MTHSDKAKILKKIGYRNFKKRGIEPGHRVLGFLLIKFYIRVNIERKGDTYIYSYIRYDKNWNFRTTIGVKQSDWDIIEDICYFIEEDIIEYNSDEWHGYNIK